MSNVLKSKRFVVRKSLVGKNQVIEFTNKKGDTINVKKEAKKLKDKLKKLKLRDIIQGKKGKNKQRNRKNTRIRKRNAQGSSNPYNRVG